MFNITTKTDYGFIVMLELAKQYKQGYVSLSEIAENKRLSAGYLVQLIQPLVKANLIESKEGKGGGYVLKKDPNKISVLNILEALDGSVNLVKCLKDNNRKCNCSVLCDAKKVWPSIIKDVQKTLAKKTLAESLKEIK